MLLIVLAVAALAPAPACLAQEKPAPPPPARESVTDLMARLDPRQREQFQGASQTFRTRHYAAALAAFQQLLAQVPGDPILAKFASESALFTGDTAFALSTLKPIARADPDDWQAAALLTRACAESGDTSCRDSGIAHMQDLKARGLTPTGMPRYMVERAKTDQGMLTVWLSLQPWGPYNIYALGEVADDQGRTFLRATLESSDGDQALFAKDHPEEAARGVREFSLDAYRDTGRNGSGQMTQTHYTFKFFVGQPSYGEIRDEFLKIANGQARPMSSRSGLIVK